MEILDLLTPDPKQLGMHNIHRRLRRRQEEGMPLSGKKYDILSIPPIHVRVLPDNWTKRVHHVITSLQK
jgi:hypothetical protein